MKLFSALHIAALHGQAHLVDLLIQHGAVVNASDYLGYTPLHLACQKGYQNIVVSELCKYYSEKNWVDSYQNVVFSFNSYPVLKEQKYAPLKINVKKSVELISNKLF